MEVVGGLAEVVGGISDVSGLLGTEMEIRSALGVDLTARRF